MCDIYLFSYQMEKLISTTGAWLTALAFNLNTCWYHSTGKVTRNWEKNWICAIITGCDVLKCSGCFISAHSFVTTDSTQRSLSPFRVTWDFKKIKTFILRYVSGWLNFMESFSPWRIPVHYVSFGPLYFKGSCWPTFLSQILLQSPAGISGQLVTLNCTLLQKLKKEH